MQTRTWYLGALLVTSMMACSSQQQGAVPAAQASPSPQSSPGPSGGGDSCPMMASTAGTQISTADTPDGVAIVFTTPGSVADLRVRVRRMADMHNQMAGMHDGTGGHMQGGGMGSGMHGGMGMNMQMVPSRASVEDVPGGARLVLVPDDPAQLAAVRDQGRMHAQMMQQGHCPMMAMPAQRTAPAGEHEGRPGGV